MQRSFHNPKSELSFHKHLNFSYLPSIYIFWIRFLNRHLSFLLFFVLVNNQNSRLSLIFSRSFLLFISLVTVTLNLNHLSHQEHLGLYYLNSWPIGKNVFSFNTHPLHLAPCVWRPFTLQTSLTHSHTRTHTHSSQLPLTTLSPPPPRRRSLILTVEPVYYFLWNPSI